MIHDEVSDTDGVAAHERRDRRQVPRVDVERVGEPRLELGRRRQRTAAGVDETHVLPAIRREDVTQQELAARSHVVASFRIERIGEIVARAPDVLVQLARMVLVAGNQEARERDAGRTGRDAVRLLPVVRPVREVLVGEPERGLADFDLVQHSIAHYVRELSEDLVVVFLGRIRGRRVVGGGGQTERLPQPAPADLGHRAHSRRELIVQAAAADLPVVRPLQRDVEERVRRAPDAGPRLLLVFIVGEEVQLVPQHGAADGRAVLLVVDRFHLPVGADGAIWRIEQAVAKVASEQPRELIGPRLGDHIDLHGRRPALRRVEPVRDELEFGNRILAVPRLAAGPELRRHLLAIHVVMELSRLAVIAVRQRSFRVFSTSGVGNLPAPRCQQREVDPVPPVHRQLRHLPRIDVAAERRRRRLDERRFGVHRQRLGNARGRHLQIGESGLAQQQVDYARLGIEALKLGRDPERADAHGQSVRPAIVGHRFKCVAGRFVHGADGYTREHAPR